MFPEMKTTEPYSPTARANASAKPVASAGQSVGKSTRRKVCQRLAPRLAAASSSSGSRSCEHGLHGAHHERQPDEASATATPSGV